MSNLPGAFNGAARSRRVESELLPERREGAPAPFKRFAEITTSFTWSLFFAS